MTSPDDKTSNIRVLGLEDTEERSLFKRSEEFRYSRAEIPTDVLAKRVGDFLSSMQEVIDKAPQETENFQLDQIQVAVEVSAKGQLSLLGTGGEVAGKGGLNFTFTRRKKSPSA